MHFLIADKREKIRTSECFRLEAAVKVMVAGRVLPLLFIRL